MKSIKEDIIDFIRKLPDDSTIDDIMYHLYVRKKILAGLIDIEQGKLIPHEKVMENVKKRLKQWLK
ncbi:MAG: hypothetical protein ACP6IY_11170 [Promethearchaeia archaeon]